MSNSFKKIGFSAISRTYGGKNVTTSDRVSLATTFEKIKSSFPEKCPLGFDVTHNFYIWGIQLGEIEIVPKPWDKNVSPDLEEFWVYESIIRTLKELGTNHMPTHFYHTRFINPTMYTDIFYMDSQTIGFLGKEIHGDWG